MSSTEEGGDAVGAVSTDQTIININTDDNPLETIIPIPGTNFTRSNSELWNLRSLEEAFDGDELVPSAKPLIQRVPSTLRRSEDFKKYFKPKVISIGPLHRRPAFLESEKLKLKLAAHFVKNIGVDKDTLYNNVKTKIGELKECYNPQEMYGDDNEALAWMFFVDGCAILQAVYMRYGDDDDDGKLFIKNDLLTFVYSDLFLLENQLPFRVLELLTSPRENGEKFMNAIQRFIDDTVINPGEDSEWWWKQQKEGERIHLLHLLRERLLVEQPRWWYSWLPGVIHLVERSWPLWLKELKKARTKRYHSHTIGNVKELKKAGIRLQASKTSCLTDISFNHFFLFGKLWLPPIIVDDSTMNLIAYEMCPDFNNNFTVASYMCFLDLLIDEAEDVKDMRDAGILYNRLGSDEEVAKLFNKMNTDLVPSPIIYSEVKEKIRNHCKNMWINQAAQGYHTYFRNPWTCLTFLGASAALTLSALQTYYAMQQQNQGSSNHKN